MNFLHPGLALAALGSIALPIAIHLLFRRRRTPIDWAAMDLLREAIRRTNRKLRFEQWLLLALRCLCVLVIGLAIAVPMSDSTILEGRTPRLWMLIVDNGATSALTLGAESELDRLRNEARRALTTRGPHDAVGIITAAVPPRVVLAPTTDAVQIEQELSRIESAQTPSDLPRALELAREASLSGSPSEGGLSSSGAATRVVVASGFRRASLPDGVDLSKGVTKPETTKPTPSASETLGSSQSVEYLAVAPASEAPTDVRITRVESRPSPSGDALSLRATLVREGSDLSPAQSRVRVAGEGFTSPPTRTTQWDAGQSEASLEFQLVRATSTQDIAAPRNMSPHSAVQVILDDDVLAVGNAYFNVVDVRRELEVGVIGRRGSFDESDIERIPASLWVSRALAPGAGSGMRIRELDPSACDARALLGLDAVVIARPDLLAASAVDALAAFVHSGAVAVVLPTGDAIAQPWGATLFPRMGVSARTDAEAHTESNGVRLSEEQPTSALLASLHPELAALTAPIEVTRVLAIHGASSAEVILTLSDGTPFVVAQIPTATSGSTTPGLVVAFASAPELTWSNLPVKPLMVPLFQELIRAGISLAARSAETVVGEHLRAQPSTLFRSHTGSTLATSADGVSESVASEPGIWRSDAGDVVVTNVRESALAITPSTSESVRQAFASLGGVRIAQASDEESLKETHTAGKWSAALFAFGLAVLFLEGLLSRLFSHASVARAGRADHGITAVGRVRGGSNSRSREERVMVGGST